MTHLTELTGTDTGPDDPRVVLALERYLAEVEAGRPPVRSTFLAEYPEVAGPLADCLAGLDLLRAAAEAEPPTTLRDIELDGEGDRLGDFRLLGEIGRGGMGVVYEAVQLSLGRRVAVKTLPSAAGRPSDVRRFRHEARAAGMLAHPNIVPVYAVGFDNGIHYIAMRLIRGRSLAELIDEPRNGTTRRQAGPHAPTADDNPADPPIDAPSLPPPDPRAAAAIAVQAADALAHAHTAGIVHRDIKPGNLLVDDAGHLWVTDFGLAFLPGASRLTQTGAMVGTLRYMSPEQVEPERGAIDHRCDLYALGATLYELLTGRPVIDGDDYWTVVPRILNRAPIPPRKLNPKVPVDLETVVLKLLEKDPADRYPTASAVADDLRRFLAGEPVAARRPCLSERAMRWVVRNRKLALGTAALLFLAVAGQAVNQYRICRERDRTRSERQQARAAVDDLYTHFSEQWLAHEPGAEPRQREFLVKALAHYERLAAAEDGSLADRLAAAVARRRVADIDAKLGRQDEADAGYRMATTRLLELKAADPGWAKVVREAAIAATGWGNLFRHRGDTDAAGREYRTAAEGFRSLVDGGSSEPFDRAGLAGVENNQGLLWRQLGEPTAAEACFRSARSRYAALAAEFPDRSVYVSETAGCGHNLADTLAELGRDREAEAAYWEALVLRRRAADLSPGVPVYRRELARTQTSLAVLLLRTERADAGAELAAEAVRGRDWLATAFPETPAYRVQLAAALRVAAECADAAGNDNNALLDLSRAVGLLRPLRELRGASAELARTRIRECQILARSGRQTEAETAMKEAAAVAAQLSDAEPYDREVKALVRTAQNDWYPSVERDTMTRPTSTGPTNGSTSTDDANRTEDDHGG